MSTRFSRLLRMIGDAGPLHTLRLIRHRAAAARWERRLGVDTAGDHLLSDEGIASPERHDHSASSVLDLHRAIRLATQAPELEVFLDLGSGKGRAVLLAATLPFRRVIGVEFSPHLSALAQHNLDVAHPHLRCGHVELVTTAAEDYNVPDDVSIVYLYNPFKGEAMNRVCENLRRSLLAAPRRLTIVVATPPHFERAVAGQSWVRRQASFVGLRRHVLCECSPSAG